RVVGRGNVAFGPQRAVSRRALRRPVYHAVLDAGDTDRLSEQPARRSVADSLRVEPDGRSGRGLPLVAARPQHFAAADSDRLVSGFAGDINQRVLLFPANGKALRRHNLICRFANGWRMREDTSPRPGATVSISNPRWPTAANDYRSRGSRMKRRAFWMN